MLNSTFGREELSRLTKSLPLWLREPDPEIYLSDNYIVIDDETTNIDKGSPVNPRNRLILTVARLGPKHPSYNGGHNRTLYFWGGEYEQAGLSQLVQDADFIVAHNLKREYGWLLRRGYDLRKLRGYCTQIAEYVLAGNIKKPLSLDATAKRYGFEGKHEYVTWCIHNGICPSEIPESLLQPYCEQDVDQTEKLFRQQRITLHELGLLPVCYQRNLITPCLTDLEFNGVQLDGDRVRERYTNIQRDFNAAIAALAGVYGEINWNSPKQVASLIYGRLGFTELRDGRGNELRTAGGKSKTDSKTIPLLRGTTKEQREFHKLYSPLYKLKKQAQNIKKLQACCESDDKGIMYAQFNQTVTRSHRLSSTGGRWKFQFHNFDRGFKSLFRARRQGWLVADADAPQLEFRVACYLGRDSAARALIESDGDVHKLTASVLGVDRQAAKSHTFKPLYGGESGTKRERAYYKAFRDAYPEVFKEQSRWVDTVLKRKELRIASGLLFYWPNTKMLSDGYVQNKASIFNYPVQSFATADIIPLSLVLLWYLMDGMKSFIVNTIHDSIIAEVSPDEVEKYKEYVEQAFTGEVLYDILDRLYKIKFDVPLGAGLKIAPFWGETKEEIKFKAKEETWQTRKQA